jgi:GTP-binding protein
LLLEAVQFQSPQRGGMFRPKLRYAHQGGMNPPVIVVHGNSLEHVTDTYKRFLESLSQGVEPVWNPTSD